MAEEHHADPSDPDTLGGEPFFAGTNVPVQTFLDYLKGGQAPAQFLADYPAVKPEQARGVLESKMPPDPEAVWTLEEIEFFLEVTHADAEHIRSDPVLSQAVETMRAKGLRDTLAHYIHGAVIVPLTPPRMEVPPIPDLAEISQMLRQKVERWTQEWRREGEAGLLLRLLEIKFGDLPESVKSGVEPAESEQLLIWAERLLTATSLDGVIELGDGHPELGRRPAER